MPLRGALARVGKGSTARVVVRPLVLFNKGLRGRAGERAGPRLFLHRRRKASWRWVAPPPCPSRLLVILCSGCMSVCVCVGGSFQFGGGWTASIDKLPRYLLDQDKHTVALFTLCLPCVCFCHPPSRGSLVSILVSQQPCQVGCAERQCLISGHSPHFHGSVGLSTLMEDFGLKDILCRIHCFMLGWGFWTHSAPVLG